MIVPDLTPGITLSPGSALRFFFFLNLTFIVRLVNKLQYPK